MKNEKLLENDVEGTKKEVIQSFQRQLNGSFLSEGESMLDNISQLISDQQNHLLCAFPTIEEIISVIKGMNMDSAASPDGFNGYFYIAWGT